MRLLLCPFYRHPFYGCFGDTFAKRMLFSETGELYVVKIGLVCLSLGVSLVVVVC